MTCTDIDDYRTTSSTVPRATADQQQRPAYATAMSRTATPTPRDADPWSAASALMLLHNGNDRHTPTNGVIARLTTGDAVLEGTRRPTLPTPASDTPATATQTSTAAPVVNVIAGDIDLLLPRFGSDSNLDADDWVIDFAHTSEYGKYHPTTPSWYSALACQGQRDYGSKRYRTACRWRST